MKIKHLILFFTIFIFSIGIINIVWAYNEISKPPPITSQGSIPFTPQALLDNFDTGSKLNMWNCATGTFSKKNSTATCTATYTNSTIAYGGVGKSLQLNYNVNEQNSYAGYSSNIASLSLISTGAGYSLTGYTAVSFYVKGAAGGEFFKVQLKNAGATEYDYSEGTYTTKYYRNTAALYITDYLDGGVTTVWRKVTIPFKNFVNLDSLGNMVELDIIFENSQSSQNGSPTNGTIYIDNITFETTAVDTVRVDYFGHKALYNGNEVPGPCALGGNVGAMKDKESGGGLITIFPDAATYNPYKYSMRIDYDVTAAHAWVGTFLIFGGGQDKNADPATSRTGMIAIPQDFSAYNYIYLSIKADSDAQNPKTMNMELVDSANNKRYVILDLITTAWATYPVEIAKFAGLDITNIKQMNFVITGDSVASESGSKTGRVYIDSIRFIKI